MATLQKFKLLATQCTVISSPTRSPTTSPVIHIRRRRKTLRMLLGSRHHRRRDAAAPPPSSDVKSSHSTRSKLKDLFVSSPPSPQTEDDVSERLMTDGGLRSARIDGVRPLSATLRQRLLLRRAWRPVLVAIPEVSP
ncbi:uncharacterized protein LOC141604387 [Silene latifolia]|uniref:uncharacterized protein LOC141604387 n=1 Tax=Silene latifolia TaxID=37657 RepID=UPI003D7816C8